MFDLHNFAVCLQFAVNMFSNILTNSISKNYTNDCVRYVYRFISGRLASIVILDIPFKQNTVQSSVSEHYMEN